MDIRVIKDIRIMRRDIISGISRISKDIRNMKDIEGYTGFQLSRITRDYIKDTRDVREGYKGFFLSSKISSDVRDIRDIR